jgi:hypothetical protein
VEFIYNLKQQAPIELAGPIFVAIYYPHPEVRGGIHKYVEAADHL